jgi:hypothetical protein
MSKIDFEYRARQLAHEPAARLVKALRQLAADVLTEAAGDIDESVNIGWTNGELSEWLNRRAASLVKP